MWKRLALISEIFMAHIHAHQIIMDFRLRFALRAHFRCVLHIETTFLANGCVWERKTCREREREILFIEHPALWNVLYSLYMHAPHINRNACMNAFVGYLHGQHFARSFICSRLDPKTLVKFNWPNQMAMVLYYIYKFYCRGKKTHEQEIVISATYNFLL